MASDGKAVNDLSPFSSIRSSQGLKHAAERFPATINACFCEGAATTEDVLHL